MFLEETGLFSWEPLLHFHHLISTDPGLGLFLFKEVLVDERQGPENSEVPPPRAAPRLNRAGVTHALLPAAHRSSSLTHGVGRSAWSRLEPSSHRQKAQKGWNCGPK